MQAIQADIRENKGKREKRQKEEKKRRRSRRKQKKHSPLLSPGAPLHKKSPPKKSMRSIHKICLLWCTAQARALSLPYIKKEIFFIRNFWSDVCLSERRRRNGVLVWLEMENPFLWASPCSCEPSWSSECVEAHSPHRKWVDTLRGGEWVGCWPLSEMCIWFLPQCIQHMHCIMGPCRVRRIGASRTRRRWPVRKALQLFSPPAAFA